MFPQCDGVFGGGGGVWVPQQAAREVSPGFIHLFPHPDSSMRFPGAIAFIGIFCEYEIFREN